MAPRWDSGEGGHRLNLLLEPPAFRGASSWTTGHDVYRPTPQLLRPKTLFSCFSGCSVLVTNMEEGRPGGGDSGGRGPQGWRL